jgi:hypothetical protein
MSDKKRRLLLLAAASAGTSVPVFALVMPHLSLSDPGKGTVMGVLLGISIFALIKLKRTPAAR